MAGHKLHCDSVPQGMNDKNFEVAMGCNPIGRFLIDGLPEPGGKPADQQDQQTGKTATLAS